MLLRGQVSWAIRLDKWLRKMEVVLYFSNLGESLPSPVVKWGKSLITVGITLAAGWRVDGGGKVWR